MPKILPGGRALLLDSAMGSELERRGLSLDPPLWSARAIDEAPDAVLRIHRKNVDAGADILTANTFRTAPFTVDRTALRGKSAELSKRAVSLAREAALGASRPILVAGSVAPLEDCYRPDLAPDDPVLEAGHAAHVANLVAAGVDLLLIETMNNSREARIAAEAAAASGAPAVVSFVTDGSGRLLSGERLEDAVAAVLDRGVEAVGINCVDSRSALGEFGRLAAFSGGARIFVYANTLSSGDSPENYANRAKEWIAAGVSIVGGCCGTTPEHTRALRAVL